MADKRERRAFTILHPMLFEGGEKIGRGRFVTDNPKWIAILNKSAGAIEAPLEEPPPGRAVAVDDSGLVENVERPDVTDAEIAAAEAEAVAAARAAEAKALEEAQAKEPDWSYKTKSELAEWIEQHLPEDGEAPPASATKAKLIDIASALWASEMAAEVKG